MARRKAYPLHTSQTTDQGASDPRLDQEEAPALLLARFRRTFSFLSEGFLSDVSLSEVSLSGPGLVSSPSRTCAAPGSETRTARERPRVLEHDDRQRSRRITTTSARSTGGAETVG